MVSPATYYVRRSSLTAAMMRFQTMTPSISSFASIPSCFSAARSGHRHRDARLFDYAGPQRFLPDFDGRTTALYRYRTVPGLADAVGSLGKDPLVSLLGLKP
jgi:hypothetical protein